MLRHGGRDMMGAQGVLLCRSIDSMTVLSACSIQFNKTYSLGLG